MRLSSLTTAWALTALAAALPAQAQQKLIPAQSEIAFVTRQMGVPVEGRFSKFDAQPAAAKIGFTIALVSAAIGTAETEAELGKPDWFDTSKFPQATFNSTAVRSTGAGKFEVAGTLSIKGRQQPVTVPVLLAQVGGITTASGTFMLKRLDFKIGDGDWKDISVVAKAVKVRYKLQRTGGAEL